MNEEGRPAELPHLVGNQATLSWLRREVMRRAETMGVGPSFEGVWSEGSQRRWR